MDKSKESFWLLSRAKTLPAEVSEKVEAMIDQYFDRKDPVFITAKHDDT
jgi:hypothetical protein